MVDTPALSSATPVAARASSPTSSAEILWDATSLAVDRRLEAPAAYVERALTQPEGTLSLAFANYAAFIGTTQSVGWVPVFAFGVTSDVEFAVSAPLRYDEGLRDWTFLDPIVDLMFKVSDSDDLEIALRAGALFPVTSEAGTALRLGVPLLYRFTNTLRLDAAAELMWTFGKPTAAGVRFPVGLTWQAASWFYTGLGGAPNVGVSGSGKTGVDPFALVGLTLGARGRAQMDVSVRFFAENLGAGDEGKLADGAGTIISVGFFPDLY